MKCLTCVSVLLNIHINQTHIHNAEMDMSSTDTCYGFSLMVF